MRGTYNKVKNELIIPSNLDYKNNVELKTINNMEENNNKNEQERKKMIQNYFYGDVKNVLNGDYFD